MSPFAPASRPRGQRAVNLFKASVVNAVPLWGLVHSGWAGSTLLCLYWCETVLATLLNAVRMLVHRALTQKRGYFAPPGAPGKARAHNAFLSEYLGIALLFSLAHGVFLAGLLFLMARNYSVPLPDLRALRTAVLWLAAAMLAGLAVDLWRIRRQPFAWVRRLRDTTVQRVFLVHVTIILGSVLMAWQARAAAFFVFFALFKLALDLVTALGTDEVPERPPGCLTALFSRLAPNRDAAALWRKTILDERAAIAHNEESLPPS